MLVDLHVHTDFSFDSEEKAENYVKKAEELGVKITGFSEHYDYDAYLDGAGISLADISGYLSRVNAISKNSPGVQILRGIEFGYRKDALNEYAALAKLYPFDYVINSVHTLAGRGDCYHDDFFAGRTIKESYRDYFSAVLESVAADFDYQIVGHIGYVSRYREGEGTKINYSDYADVIDEILKEIIGRDKCLEINTSTGKTGGLSLPDCDIIKRYIELGGVKMSFGSDAHKCADYLRKATQLTEFLHSIGVKRLYYYKNRRPIAYEI